MDKCPVCYGFNNFEFSRDKKRVYYHCENCGLVFVPRNLLLNSEEEKNRYESHQNAEESTEYQNYLKSIADSIIPFLIVGDVGLDFGSGATTLLADYFETQGFEVKSYDIYFHPNEEIWNEKFDFIVLSEVIEHLREPLETLKKLKTLLKPNGRFFIKTKFHPYKKEAFDQWFYKRDMTHVQFFERQSMNYLAKALGFAPYKMIGEDLCLLSPTLIENTLSDSQLNP